MELGIEGAEPVDCEVVFPVNIIPRAPEEHVTQSLEQFRRSKQQPPPAVQELKGAYRRSLLRSRTGRDVRTASGRQRNRTSNLVKDGSRPEADVGSEHEEVRFDVK